MNAPINGLKFVMPDHMLSTFEAVTWSKWNCVSRNTMKFASRPIVANLSNVSFPVLKIKLN